MKRVVTVAAGLALVGIVSGGALGAPKAQKVTLALKEFSFTPNKVTVQAGVPVEVTLTNKGTVNHEFLLYDVPKGKPDDMDAWAIGHPYFKNTGEVVVEFPGVGAVAGEILFETEVFKGKTAMISFTPKKKGTFEFGCMVEGHYNGGMHGTLTIK